MTRRRRGERILEPYLSRKVFPRRRRPWHRTSQSTRARLALLPENPHVRIDVQAIRSALCIPDNHVGALEDDPIRQALLGIVEPEFLKRAIEG